MRIVEVERGRAQLKSLHRQLQAVAGGSGFGASAVGAMGVPLGHSRSSVRPHKRARTTGTNGGPAIDAVSPKKARTQLGQWAEVALLTVLGHPSLEELEGVAAAAAAEHDSNDAVVQLRGCVCIQVLLSAARWWSHARSSPPLTLLIAQLCEACKRCAQASDATIHYGRVCSPRRSGPRDEGTSPHVTARGCCVVRSVTRTRGIRLQIQTSEVNMLLRDIDNRLAAAHRWLAQARGVLANNRAAHADVLSVRCWHCRPAQSQPHGY